MRRLYFRRDSERGALGTYEWLSDEVEELGDALKVNDKKGMEGVRRCNRMVSFSRKRLEYRS